MEAFLAQLCGTSRSQPLPVWEGDAAGHCFTQLGLSALPHALLAVLSACHWGTPRWVVGAGHTSGLGCLPELESHIWLDVPAGRTQVTHLAWGACRNPGHTSGLLCLQKLRSHIWPDVRVGTQVTHLA